MVLWMVGLLAVTMAEHLAVLTVEHSDVAWVVWMALWLADGLVEQWADNWEVWLVVWWDEKWAVDWAGLRAACLDVN